MSRVHGSEKRCLGLLLLAGSASADWPQFRGPNGSGVDSGGRLPAGPARDRTLAWSAAVPFGRSSPGPFDNRLLITASDGDRLVTLCFSRIDGQLLWRHEVKKTRITERVERLNRSCVPDAGGRCVRCLCLLSRFRPGGIGSRRPRTLACSTWAIQNGVRAGFVAHRGRWDRGAGVRLAGRFFSDRRRCADRSVHDGASSGQTCARAGSRQQSSVREDAPGPGRWSCRDSARIEGIDLQTGRRTWQVTGSGAENLGVPIADDEGRLYVNVRGFAQPTFPSWATQRDQFDDNRDARLSHEEVKANPIYY